MALLGSIIKGALKIHEMLTDAEDHVAAQKKVLTELLTTASRTEFGRHYGFDEILQNEHPEREFAKRIPYHDYKKMNKAWWKKIHRGVENVSWPGQPDYFARSSGTTGKKSKMIPVTDDMIKSIRSGGAKQLSALTRFDLPSDIFEKEVMALGSSTELDEYKGFKVGEISGISAGNIPGWLDNWYKPGQEIAAVDDWDKRVDLIARNAKNWDIGTLSGIPSWIEMMLKKVIDYHNVKNIHEIWPNLSIYMSGGVAFQPYEKSFNALMERPLTVVDTYLASEGFLACQHRPGTKAMQLLTNNGIYFEFVPFKEEYIKKDGSIKASAPALSFEEAEAGVDYALIISTVSGAWRYLIGDTIMFTDKEKAEIVITGRTKFFLNVVGSQLSVLKMEKAMLKMQKKFYAAIKEFTVCAKKVDGEFHHIWYLGTDATQSEQQLAGTLDKLLKKANKNYKVARSKALKGVIVKKVSPDTFYEWSDFQKKKGGQVKMECVMDEDKFEEWEKFVGKEALIR